MIIVDLETSGFLPDKHAILSIGAVEFNNVGNTFYMGARLREGAEISPQALEVNGFTQGNILQNSKPTERFMLQKFVSWVISTGDEVFTSNVTAFDFEFLKYAFSLYNIQNPFMYRPLDLHSICYKAMVDQGIDAYKDNNFKLIEGPAIFDFVGIPNEPLPHNALNGARYETEILHRVLRGESVIDEFRSFEVPDYLKK